MVRLKFWQKESPIEETPLPYVEDDLDFWGFGPVDWESDPEFEPLAPGDLDLPFDPGDPDGLPGDFVRAFEALVVTARAEKQDLREYEQCTDFSYWETRKPIPPRSALLAPPKLTPKEKEAVALFDTVTKYIDGLDVKLKPTLAKKKREAAKGYRRVVFDDKGKMKVVKGA